MNFVRSLFQFLRRLEGLPIAMVLLALYVALIIAAPTVFTRPLIYISFLETVCRALHFPGPGKLLTRPTVPGLASGWPSLPALWWDISMA